MVMIIGADTALGAAMATALSAAGFQVLDDAAERVPIDCNRVLYCHDAARDPEGHVAALDALCRSLAATRTMDCQVHFGVFTPANACAKAGRAIRETAMLKPLCQRDLAHAQAELLLHSWFGRSRTAILPIVFRHGELYAAPDDRRPLAGHVNACLRRAKSLQPMRFPGLGLQKRTLTHLDDFASAVAAVLKGDFLPDVINVPGETMAIADYMNDICSHYGLEASLASDPFDDDLPWGLGDRVLSAAEFRSELPDFRLRHRFRSWLALGN